MNPQQWVDHNQHGATASDALLAVDALRAVLELHKPRHGFGTTICEGCSDDPDDGWAEHPDVMFMEYPCPTVRTIADTLGAEL